jgi:membrane-bound metal-dependent hydrolase YbcI (DUF457 family)
LNLPTHAVFGIAVGLVFFGRPEIALLIGLGALLPDLDREYWFIPAKIYHDEQYHRALFHNVFIMALAYLVSPFFSLGFSSTSYKTRLPPQRIEDVSGFTHYRDW